MIQLDNNDAMELFCHIFDKNYRDCRKIFTNKWTTTLRQCDHNIMWKHLRYG